MKIRAAFLSLLAVSTSMVVSAQVEHDDMYFNAKDRAKLQASKPMVLSSIATEHNQATVATINPTDSYSARNVNPEYISQSKMGSGTTEQAPYFIPDYTPAAVNQNLSSNKKSSSGSGYYNYNNLGMSGFYPSYGMYGYGSPYNSFYPSMYGYNPYGFNNCMCNSGWSTALSLGFGFGSFYPYGGYYPYGGSSWMMGFNSFYGNPYRYGMGYGFGYPYNNVIIINDYNSRNVAYGRRTSRSSDINNTVSYSNRNRTSTLIPDSQGRVSSTSGRVASDGTSSSYYQRGWRTNPETASGTTRSGWSTSGRTSNDMDSFRSNSGYNSRSNSSFFDNSGSRSSSWGGSNSSFSTGGGSRSSGMSSGSSSGVRRGRD